jgi:hypothetical protein
VDHGVDRVAGRACEFHDVLYSSQSDAATPMDCASNRRQWQG